MNYGDLWKTQIHHLSQLSLIQTQPEDISWIREILQTPNFTDAERAWLEILLDLVCWHRRHDIELGNTISIGEFDIEIE